MNPAARTEQRFRSVAPCTTKVRRGQAPTLRPSDPVEVTAGSGRGERLGPLSVLEKPLGTVAGGASCDGASSERWYDA